MAPAPKAPTPSLSLVAPADAPSEEVASHVDLVTAEVAAEAGVPIVVPGPRPAGWYPDPSGIHCERAWDGSAWGAVVLDRNRALLEHALRDDFPPPAQDRPHRALSCHAIEPGVAGTRR